MWVETGHFALHFAFALALLQTVAGIWRDQAALARRCAFAQSALIGLAFAALVRAYVSSDFSVQNVAENSHTMKPMLYKITGVWGNHEGSMLLWVLVLGICTGLVAWRKGMLPETVHTRMLGIQGVLNSAFLAFTLFTSNPFLRLDPAPPEGSGLNPILQDPGLAFHPPTLYVGYVGLSVVFAGALAGLQTQQINAVWAGYIRQWAQAAWIFLTAGIALGSWWAYYELGWGGFWFWDPVENASFMPWLLATALMHSLIVLQKREMMKKWTLMLAILAFGLSMLGTFLVRSGVLTSVHAFANDPERGLWILLIMLASVGGGLALFGVRARHMRSREFFQFTSREAGLIANNLFLLSAGFTVFVGTLAPLALDILGAGLISVGPPYYTRSFIPIIVPMIVLLGVGPMLSWGRTGIRQIKTVLLAAVLCGAGVTLGLVALSETPKWSASAGFALGAWVIGSVFAACWRVLKSKRTVWSSAFRAQAGMLCAHFGVGILIIGISGASLLERDDIAALKRGEHKQMDKYQVHLHALNSVEGPNYQAIRAQISVRSPENSVRAFAPERRLYQTPANETTEIAIHSSLLQDLQISTSQPDAEGTIIVRMLIKPFMIWVWAGGAMMALGGLLALMRSTGGKDLPQPAFPAPGNRKAKKQETEP